MTSLQTATTSLGYWEVALQTIDDSERLILIESMEEGDNLKIFFFFEIQGDFVNRAGTVGILRGLIGSFCMNPPDLSTMYSSIREEFEQIFQGEASPLISFMILQIDSRSSKFSYLLNDFPSPVSIFDDHTRTDEFKENRNLQGRVVEIEVGPGGAYLIFPKVSNGHEISSLVASLGKQIDGARSSSALAIFLAVDAKIKSDLQLFQDLKLHPLACIKRTSK